ncbi:MAG: hypothetical protein QOD73_551 [Solirubrobacteraceae bacterium]|jgi:hypothetical protein|nr:hypothetical protein [Solirubrobacteraceae bacterium]
MRPPVDLRRFLPCLLMVLAGLAVIVAGGDGVTPTAVAIALIGVGGVLGVAAAFWEIGASEDRARRPRRR